MHFAEEISSSLHLLISIFFPSVNLRFDQCYLLKQNYAVYSIYLFSILCNVFLANCVCYEISVESMILTNLKLNFNNSWSCYRRSLGRFLKVMLWCATLKNQSELMNASMKAYNVAYKDTVGWIWISREFKSMRKVKEISCFKRDFQHHLLVFEKNKRYTYIVYKDKLRRFLKDLKSKTLADNDFVVVKAIAYNQWLIKKDLKTYKLWFSNFNHWL